MATTALARIGPIAKSLGKDFITESIRVKGRLAKSSYRTAPIRTKRGKVVAWATYACPSGKWKRGRCIGGMKAVRFYHPKSHERTVARRARRLRNPFTASEMLSRGALGVVAAVGADIYRKGRTKASEYYQRYKGRKGGQMKNPQYAQLVRTAKGWVIRDYYGRGYMYVAAHGWMWVTNESGATRWHSKRWAQYQARAYGIEAVEGASPPATNPPLLVVTNPKKSASHRKRRFSAAQLEAQRQFAERAKISGWRKHWQAGGRYSPSRRKNPPLLVVTNPKKSRFRDLKNGDVFVFASEKEWWSLGMAKGPWRKTGSRTYELASDPSRYGGKLRVGSINAEVMQKNLCGTRRNPKVSRMRAATALDLTHRLGERGPRTYATRQRVAKALDVGGRLKSSDVKWLEHVSKLKANPNLPPAIAKYAHLPGFDAALKRYVKFHGTMPTKMTFHEVPMGRKDQVEVMAGLGKAPGEMYTPTAGMKKSNKAGSAWIHEYENGMPMKAVSGDGRFIVTLPGKFLVSDWIRG